MQIQANKKQKILVMALSGIGENIMLVPMVRALKQGSSFSHITFATRWPGIEKIFKSLEIIDEFLFCDYKIQDTIVKKLNLIKEIRRSKYDICINTFPANRLQKNIFAFLSGAPLRISHKYEHSSIFRLNFFNNRQVLLDYKAHDITQNLNLLSALEISTDNADRSVKISLEKTSKEKAKNILNKLGTKKEDLLIGIHAGASTLFGMENKKWPVRYWIKLLRKLHNEYKAKFLLFSGQEDEETSSIITRNLIDVPIYKISEELDTLSALIKNSHLTICTDSAISHISSALNIPTIAIFGPTDPTRTRPYSEKAVVVRKELSCSPCYGIKDIGGRIKCKFAQRKCLESITPEDVFPKVKEMLGA